ncbi:MAG TPA: hypothetical protein VIF38_09650 [Burkholderiales bacterium]
MSRLLPDRVLVALAPAALAYARVRRAPRTAVIHHGSAECSPAGGPEPWRGAVAALAPLADSLKAGRVDVTLVLSNHFVRYALVPSDPGLDTEEEQLAFARFCFAKIHGERSKAWQIRLDRRGPGSAQLASAVDDALLQAMQACFKPGAAVRLVSVQPYLMAAFNRWGRQLPTAGGSLLLVEPDRACLARLENGRWSAVHSARGSFDGATEWVRFLERERHLVAEAVPATEVLIHAPSLAAGSIETGDWRFMSVAQPAVAGLTGRPDFYLSAALCAL